MDKEEEGEWRTSKEGAEPGRRIAPLRPPSAPAPVAAAPVAATAAAAEAAVTAAAAAVAAAVAAAAAPAVSDIGAASEAEETSRRCMALAGAVCVRGSSVWSSIHFAEADASAASVLRGLCTCRPPLAESGR